MRIRSLYWEIEHQSYFRISIFLAFVEPQTQSFLGLRPNECRFGRPFKFFESKSFSLNPKSAQQAIFQYNDAIFLKKDRARFARQLCCSIQSGIPSFHFYLSDFLLLKIILKHLGFYRSTINQQFTWKFGFSLEGERSENLS